MRDSYSSVCNVLHQWSILLILTYRVYRLYDIFHGAGKRNQEYAADDCYNLVSQKQCCTGIPRFSLLHALHGEASSSIDSIVKGLETGLINTFPADSPRCTVDNIVDSFHGCF